MIGHEDVHDVLRAPRWHVTGHAVGLVAPARGVLLAATDIRFVTAEANLAEVRGALVRGKTTVRIVATETTQAPATLAKTATLLTPLGLMTDLEAVRGWRLRIGHVEWQLVVRQRLAGPEGVDVSSEPPRALNGHRGEEMTLVADFIATLRGQVSGVDDGRRRLIGLAREHGPRMVRSRSMATLTPGPLGQRARQRLRTPIAILARRELRVTVVAEHALMSDASHDAVMIWAIVARCHAPRLGLAVPGDR